MPPFTIAKNAVWRTGRNPVILAVFSHALLAGVLTLPFVPMDLIFSGKGTGIDFFEMPLAKFYLSLLLSPIEILRRTGLLAYVFFFLTLGVLSSVGRAETRSPASHIFSGSIVALQLGLFAFVLRRIETAMSPLSTIIALAFPLLYWTLLTLRRKIEAAHQIPHGA